jgi:hypothetical protein
LLYGAESWTCTKKEESKIQATEMKFMTGILGKTRRDKIRNKDIREQLKVDDIKHDMERKKLKWYGHIMRMAEERIPKKDAGDEAEGKTTRWMDQLREIWKREGRNGHRCNKTRIWK